MSSGKPQEKVGKVSKQGPTWNVEDYVEKEIALPEALRRNNNVYIRGCKNTKIAIKEKCNQIGVEGSNDFAVDIEGGQIGTFTIVDSKDITTNCTQKQGSYDITRSSNITLNMSGKDVVDSAFISNGCRGVSICFDDKKLAMPEELVSVVAKDGNITTEIVGELSRKRTEVDCRHGDGLIDLGVRDRRRAINNKQYVKLLGDKKNVQIGQYRNSNFEIDQVKTLVLDKLDNCKIKISKKVELIEMYACKSVFLNLPEAGKCADLKIFTHGCSASNVYYNDDDSKEHALPELIKCLVVADALVSSVVEHLAPS